MSQTRTETITRTQTTVQNRDGTTTTLLSPFPYQLGGAVTVWFDPADPAGTARLENDDWRVAGLLLLVFCILVLGGTWLWWWLTQKYKAVAALGGAGTVLDLAGNAFRGGGGGSGSGGMMLTTPSLF